MYHTADVQRERLERQSFARARLDLLHEVTAEDNKLQHVLDASFAHVGGDAANLAFAQDIGVTPASPMPAAHRSYLGQPSVLRHSTSPRRR